MKRLATLLLFSTSLCLPVAAVSPQAEVRAVPSNIATRGQSLWATASPDLRAFVDEQVRAGRGRPLSEAALSNAAKARFGSQSRAFENTALFLVAWKAMDGINAELNARSAASKRRVSPKPKIGSAIGDAGSSGPQAAAAEPKKHAGTSDLQREGVTSVSKNTNSADAIKKQFGDSARDLEAQDKMGNFEINTLMSDYNQAETLASSIQKKLDDTSRGGDGGGRGPTASPTPRLTKVIFKESAAGKIQVAPTPTPR